MFRIFKKFFSSEKRSVQSSAGTGWLTAVLDRLGIDGISDETALKTSTVFACIRVLSETVASLPLKFYQRADDGSKKELPDYPLAKLFQNPNQFQTKFGFWETLVAIMNLRGNYYGGINFDGSGRPAEIMPLHPSRVSVEIKNNQLIYHYQPQMGRPVDYDSRQIWHLRGLSTDGIMGISPIEYSRRALNLTISAEDHGIAYYKNGAKTSGIVKIPGKMKEDAKERLKESLHAAVGGNNKFKLILFEGGMDWQEIGISNQDSQYLQTREFQVQEICRIFRVPAVLVQHPDKTSTYASAEQFFLSFVVHTIRPWLERIEDAINDLIPPQDRALIFAEFSVEGLLRGDISSRYRSYAVGRQWGWLSTNDVRRLENMNPIGPEGDIYLQPLNMVDAGNPGADPAADPGGTPSTKTDDNANQESQPNGN